MQNENGERALVKLVPESSEDADRRHAAWQRARQLRHPHLLELRDVGRTEIAGEPYLYAAYEYPDDSLAAAIQSGPLSEPETREVVDTVVDVLRYLHSQGLVHGSIDPDHIVAVGDTIKLAADSFPESAHLEGHAEDVRQLGELVKTLRAPNPPGEPLRTIVAHATEPDPRNRWTLAEIAAAMHPAPPPAVARVPTRAPIPAAAPPLLPPPVRRRPVVEPASPVGFPRWIFVGLAGVLLLILVLNLRRGPAAPLTPATTTTMAERVAPLEPAPSPAPVTARPPTSAMWRVIAFTYGSRDAAAKKVRQLNERWPDLHASIFLPNDSRGFYLVALGGRMKREDALRVQKRARAMGLPRDIYVQNYSE